MLKYRYEIKARFWLLTVFYMLLWLLAADHNEIIFFFSPFLSPNHYVFYFLFPLNHRAFPFIWIIEPFHFFDILSLLRISSRGSGDSVPSFLKPYEYFKVKLFYFITSFIICLLLGMLVMGNSNVRTIVERKKSCWFWPRRSCMRFYFPRLSLGQLKRFQERKED